LEVKPVLLRAFFQRFSMQFAAVRFPTRTLFQSFPIVTDYGTIMAE
jgi:hypothetical protein